MSSSLSFFAQIALSESKERGRGQSPMEGNSEGSIDGGHEGVAGGSRGGGHTLVACGSRGGGHIGVVGASGGRGQVGIACRSRGDGHRGVTDVSRGGGHVGVAGGSRGGGHREVSGRSIGCGHGGVAGRSRGGGHGDVSVGSNGGGNGGIAAGTSDRIEALGKLLVRILRHMATKLKLDMRSDGYVKVRDLLKINMKTWTDIPLRSHSIDEIREAVRINKKQRLGLLEENGQLFIRANQGHTVKVVETESLLRPIVSAEEIPVCVHGTYLDVLDSIRRSGINRMGRLHVHFSSGLPSDGQVISGMRRTVNVVIFLDVKKALEDGMKLYKSENNVILTEGFGGTVPAKYFQKIMLWPSRKPVSLPTFKFQDRS